MSISRPPKAKAAQEALNINWSILVPGPGGVPIPTYGNYGGPGYSNGQVLSSPDQPVDYSAPPVDALDGCSASTTWPTTPRAHWFGPKAI